MSTNLSRLVQPFVTSVIVGKDVVPRVSVVNLGRLIDQMASLLSMAHIKLMPCSKVDRDTQGVQMLQRCPTHCQFAFSAAVKSAAERWHRALPVRTLECSSCTRSRAVSAHLVWHAPGAAERNH